MDGKEESHLTLNGIAISPPRRPSTRDLPPRLHLITKKRAAFNRRLEFT